MVHLLGWVLQLNGADIGNISKHLKISDKFFGWQVIYAMILLLLRYVRELA
jgi:hypothetical protein